MYLQVNLQTRSQDQVSRMIDEGRRLRRARGSVS